MSAIDLATNIVHTTTFHQDYPFILQVASETKKLNGTTLSSTTNTYGSASLGGMRYQTFLSQSYAAGNDLDGSALPTTASAFTYDAYNNATQIAVTLSDGSGKTTNNTFTNDTTNWFLGRLTGSTVTNSGRGKRHASVAAIDPATRSCSHCADVRHVVDGSNRLEQLQQHCGDCCRRWWWRRRWNKLERRSLQGW